MNSILLVEDDESIIALLTKFLVSENFKVTVARGQNEALEKLDEGTYDLLLLDVSLPDGNGFAVCRAAKEQTDVAVIFLTASGDEFSVVTGLDMGADDYISKPFRPRELLSRIKSVLRRTGKTQSVLSCGKITVDTVKASVYRDNEEIVLSALEYRLLLTFMTNQGVVLTRGKLLEEIWDAAGDFVNDNTLTVYIKRLREKLEEDPQNPEFIKTVRGMGYKI